VYHRRVLCGVDFTGFYHHASWILRELLAVGGHSVGFVSTRADGDDFTARFPAVSIEAYVVRRPHYYVGAMFLPLCLISALALVQFSIHVHSGYWYERIAHSVTLLLTAAAYASAVAASLPLCHHLTLLDKYLLACVLLLALCVVETPLVRLLVPVEDFTSDTAKEAANDAATLDRALLATIAAMWVGVHTYFSCWAWNAHRRARRALSLSTLAADAAAVPRLKRSRRGSRDLCTTSATQLGSGSATGTLPSLSGLRRLSNAISARTLFGNSPDMTARTSGRASSSSLYGHSFSGRAATATALSPSTADELPGKDDSALVRSWTPKAVRNARRSLRVSQQATLGGSRGRLSASL